MNDPGLGVFTLSAVVLLFGPASTQDPDEVLPTAAPLPGGGPRGMTFIDRADLRRHASHLASDELGGRYTGSEGQRKAAEYVAARFGELGLDPHGDRSGGGRAFFQEFPVERTFLDRDATGIEFGQALHANGFAVIPGKKSSKVDVRGQFVFCAEGATDDLPSGGLGRKIPVVLFREDGAGERQGMMAFRSLGRARNIVQKLESKGARLVVFCSLDDDSGLADTMNTIGLLPEKHQLSFGQGRGRNADPFGDGPVVFTGAKLSEAMLSHIGVSRSTEGGFVQARDSTRAAGRVRVAVRQDPKFPVRNVVAWLEGSSSRMSKEAVVFSAHMDHMGTRMDGDAYNGADDNASGTSGLLEVAEAFARGDRPARSILFLCVAGEELGLWGSAYFAENPTWPMDKIVANVNIDMIGRATDLSGPRAISVTPSFEHSKFSTIVRDAARLGARMGVDLTVGDQYYERSDHYNFAKQGVPVVFFCDGEHPDYHRVSDTADKLDYEKMEWVTRLAFWTGFEVAEANGRPRSLGSQRGWLADD
jgi:hypothetical protein